MRALRPVLLCAMVFGVAAPASAADPGPFSDILRGSDVPRARPYQPGTPTYVRWDGLYFGGQLGRTEAGADFSSGVQSLVAYILRNDIVADHVAGWSTLGKDTQMASRMYSSLKIWLCFRNRWSHAGSTPKDRICRIPVKNSFAKEICSAKETTLPLPM